MIDSNSSHDAPPTLLPFHLPATGERCIWPLARVRPLRALCIGVARGSHVVHHAAQLFWQGACTSDAHPAL